MRTAPVVSVAKQPPPPPPLVQGLDPPLVKCSLPAICGRLPFRSPFLTVTFRTGMVVLGGSVEIDWVDLLRLVLGGSVEID